MQPVRISKKGLVSIPAELRKKYNLKPGDEVTFDESTEGIILVPIVPIETLVRTDLAEDIRRAVKHLEEERKTE